MDKKYVDVEKINSIPTIKQQMRNINNNVEVIENSIKTVEKAIDDVEEEIEQLAANTVIFRATSDGSTKIIQEIQGVLPTDKNIPKTRFVYYDGTNIVPLSISYTGSIMASGMFIPYGDVNPKLLYFTCSYSESSIIGTEVTIEDL